MRLTRTAADAIDAEDARDVDDPAPMPALVRLLLEELLAGPFAAEVDAAGIDSPGGVVSVGVGWKPVGV